MSADDHGAQAIPAAALPGLLRLFERSEWASMSLEADGLSLTVARAGVQPPEVGSAVVATPAAAPAPRPKPAPPAPAAPAAGPDETLLADNSLVVVRAPVAGIFYVAEAPGADPFVTVGARVGAGDTVGIVEVMKLMNHVAAGIAGEVVAVGAANGELVEFDQPLVWIRPNGEAT